jgi:hypothetical protein
VVAATRRDPRRDGGEADVRTPRTLYVLEKKKRGEEAEWSFDCVLTSKETLGWWRRWLRYTQTPPFPYYRLVAYNRARREKP